jgi:hypothetical protein
MSHDTQPDPRRRPQLESLEGRALLSAGNAPRSFLLRPIPETAALVEHIHPRLTIVVDGQRRTIPANVGIQPAGNLPIHTHTADGTLHIESTKYYKFRLRDFFTIWGQPFNKNVVLGRAADKAHPITMTVNGRPSRQFGNLPLSDGQQIVIRYGA